MTNIVTRKGLAFGALVALASTAIAGAPAHAAGELNVVPSAGTSYVVSTTDTFNLKTTFAPGFTPSSYAQLKYQIVTDGVATIDAGVNTGAALTAAQVTAGPTLAPNAGAAHTTVISASRPSAGGTNANTTPYDVNDAGAAVTSTTVNYLGLNVAGGTATTTTTSVVVTAFVDANNDGALSAGEWNTVKTVTFKKYSEIVPNVVLTGANTGDTSVSATADFGDLNLDQVAGEGVAFGYTHTNNTVVALATSVAGTLSSGKWSYTTAGPLVSGTTAYAQSFIGSTLLGSAVSGTVTARTVATVTSAVVAGNDAKVGSTATSVATAGGTETQTTAATGDVRKSGTWTATATLKNATPAAVAGVSVTATVKTSATLSGTAGSVKSIAVGGTTYTSNTANTTFATVTVTTDANGVASVPVTTSGLATGETVTVTFAAQNLSSLVTVTAKDLLYSITEASTANGYITTPGATTVLNYSVKDQFGVAISGAYRLVAAVTGGSGSRTYYSAPIAAGAATISVVDAQTTTTTAASVSTTLQAQDASTLNWSDVSLTVSSGVVSAPAKVTAINYSTAALGFTTAPLINATTGINGNVWTSTGDQKQTITQAVQDSATTDSATGKVAPAAGTTWAQVDFQAVHQYSTVTVSGTGVYLALTGGTPAANTLTFQAGNALQSVFVASNTVGTKTITFVIGGVTKTVDVKFASAATTTGTVAGSAESTATTFAVAVAAAAQSGRAIDATVTVTDKWGNPVAGFDVTASVSGVAVVNGGFSANATTDENGKATVKLSAGVNDLGDAVVTFSDNDSNTSTNVTSVAKTVTFGSTDGYIDVLNGKRASVTWSFAKGKRVAVYLDGVRRYNIVQPGDAELNLQFNLKKGSHSIKLVIGGVIVDTLSVKVAG